VTDIDAAIARLEADLETLRRAKALLVGVARHFAPVKVGREQLPPELLRAQPAPVQGGRDRASVTAIYADLARDAGKLDPKICRAIKLRGEGKTQSEIATTMRLEVKQIGNMLQVGRKKIERARQSGGAPAKAAAGGDDQVDDPEPASGQDWEQVQPATTDRTGHFGPVTRIGERIAPGPRELLEARLEIVRAAPAALQFEAGRIVVIQIEDKGEQLALLRENKPGGLRIIRRVGPRGREIGKRDRVAVAGEVLRYATEREIVRGFALDEPGSVVPDAVLPPGFRNIA
jgi:hypothetical protein